MSFAGNGNDGEGCCRNCVKSARIWRSNGSASGGASEGAGEADMVVAISLMGKMRSMVVMMVMTVRSLGRAMNSVYQAVYMSDKSQSSSTRSRSDAMNAGVWKDDGSVVFLRLLGHRLHRARHGSDRSDPTKHVHAVSASCSRPRDMYPSTHERSWGKGYRVCFLSIRHLHGFGSGISSRYGTVISAKWGRGVGGTRMVVKMVVCRGLSWWSGRLEVR